MSIERSSQDHIQTQFKSRRITPESTDLDTFNRVKSRMMSNLHYSAVATALAIVATGVVNTPADAHQKHIHHKNRHHKNRHHNSHHYGNQKQNEFRRGYQKGYNKAYKNSAKKQYQYYNQTPRYYQPSRQPVVIIPAWRTPQPVIIHPNHFQYKRPHVDLGYSFFH